MERWFQRDSQRLDKYLGYARARVSSLTGLHDVAKNVYLAGSVVAPDSPEVARALHLSAQALAAVFAFRLAPLLEGYELGEGPPVRYPSPIDPSIPDVLIWRKAYDLTLITRQTVPLGYLCRVTKDTFRGSSLVGYTDEEYWFMELKQRAWQESGFGWEPLLAKCEAYEVRAAIISNSDGAEAVRRVRAPYLRVLRKLGERDAAGLEAALTDALMLHKEYWSATEERRKELLGLVSLPLVALAALAWDRGLRFEVESDYLPWSWVTGEIFAANW
ncbi:MAG: immunity 49 family protein [Bacteroidales bacterium]|nr:immunity 49 family protein [Bacteroidales bacterium]